MPPYSGNIWADMIDQERERNENLRQLREDSDDD